MRLSGIYRLFVLLLAAAAFAACQSEKYTDKGIPEVETRGATVLADGARFDGEILSDGSKNIIEHGFLWDENENPVLGESSYILLGPIGHSGGFSATVNSAIEKDKVYYLRAFVRTDDIISYGNIIIFKGGSSRPPVLSSVSPSTGVCGDTIVIKGQNFAHNPSDCRVLFGNNEARTIASDINELKVIVPAAKTVAMKIKVIVSGQTSGNSLDFEIIKPVLAVFTPLTGTFGDLITLSGSNFSTDTSCVRVYFNNAMAEITECSRTYYKVKVPNENNISPASVRIRYFDYYSYDQSFQLRQAVISSITPAASKPDEIITISGENFNPWPAGNLVEIGGAGAYVISSSSTEITLRLPRVISAGSHMLMLTTISGSPVSWPVTIEYPPAWQRLADFPSSGRIAGAGFTIGEKVYFGTGLEQLSLPVKDFWEYDPMTDHWTRKADYPVLITYPTGLSVDGKGYFALGKLDYTYYTSMMRYNPENDKWESKSSNPGPGSSMDSPGFVIDGKAYVPAAGEMYMYDPVTNTWTKKAYPSELGYLGGAAVFSINGKGYLGVCWVHQKSGNVSDFYEYDPGADTWTKRASFPGTLRNNSTSFSLPNGKGYISMGFATAESRYLNDMWEYDPILNTWTRLDDFPGSPRCGARAVVIGPYAYIMTGYGGTFEKDLYRFFAR